MNNPDTELLFPLRVIGHLVNIRGEEWRNLVECVQNDGDSSVNQHGFVLAMVKIAGCVSCNSDSFRAMRGCTQCSIQAVRRHRGSDHDLVLLFEQSRDEVEKYLKKRNLLDVK